MPRAAHQWDRLCSPDAAAAVVLFLLPALVVVWNGIRVSGGKVKQAMYIDLDVHQVPVHQHCMRDDPF